MLSIIKAFFAEPFALAYPFVSMPTLLIHASLPADLDKARAKGIEQMEHAITDVTIKAVAESAHMIQWDAPEQTADQIRSWLSVKLPTR
ncbi:alpha/beta fold hydrolase [Planococcus sp. YIM B11945]|uniref:alpha/beta fold hydrolase n=1 Tax=Planococcus sp. YIM B11945 TaxID=3435410 RepID=UPI003D7C53F0